MLSSAWKRRLVSTYSGPFFDPEVRHSAIHERRDVVNVSVRRNGIRQGAEETAQNMDLQNNQSKERREEERWLLDGLPRRRPRWKPCLPTCLWARCQDGLVSVFSWAKRSWAERSWKAMALAIAMLTFFFALWSIRSAAAESVMGPGPYEFLSVSCGNLLDSDSRTDFEQYSGQISFPRDYMSALSTPQQSATA